MTIQNVDAKTLKQWLDNGEAILIDVREPEEHYASSIPGSINIPLSILTLSSLPERGDKKLVLHCAAGKRSNTGCEKLLTEEPGMQVYSLEDGIKSWAAAGYPLNNQVDALSFKSMPTSTQNHLILGGLILLGSLLGLVFNTAWFLIPAGIGGVMLYEGLTGANLIEEWLDKLPFRKK